jgi:TolB-like protein/DNA-binding winged helix-turn-helix (wHTH) protein/Tfp pilus assembly protein PilF
MLDDEVVYYNFDNFCLDLEKKQLLKNGEPVLLTHKAFQTLHILVQNFGQIVEKEDIYKQLWADSFVEESNLTQYIYLLRKTLDKNPAGVSYIETVARRGYIFTAQVEKVLAAKFAPQETIKIALSEDRLQLPQTARIADESEKTFRPNNSHLQLVNNGKTENLIAKKNGQSNGSGLHLEKPKNQQWTGRFVPLALLLIFVVLGSLGLINYFQKAKPNEPTAPVNSSIAVLPFRPIDEESNNAKLGLGMAEAIITRLSKLQQIPVRPTSAILRYTDQPASSLAETGRELGVDTILEGTVQRDGDRVRVSVQLISVADGKPLWAEMFDEKYTNNLFALQDSIAGKVAESLSLELTPRQWKLLEQRPTNDPEAFEAYQLGVYFWNTRTKENLQKASEYFQKAVEIDSQFAQAYGMLADTYNLLGYYHFANRDEMYEKSRVTAARALALDATIAEAHMAMAFVQTDEDAKTSLERAIELAPYNSTVRIRYAWILFRIGEMEQAVTEMQSAQEYDPLSPVTNGALCNMLIFRERFPEAIKICKKAVELGPKTADNRLALANAYFFNGNTEEAIAQAKIDVETSDRKFSSLGSLAYFYAKLGRRAEAEAIVNQLKPEAEKDAGLYNDLALINYALGKKDESFAYFQKSYRKRALPISMVRQDPVWKEIRQDQRFIQLLEQ